MGKMRCWWKLEFDDTFTNEDDRNENAWRVPDERGIFDQTRIIPCEDVGDAAQKYAEFFWHERDGSDDKWPIEVVVHDGENYWAVDVDREFEVTFEATNQIPIDVKQPKAAEHG